MSVDDIARASCAIFVGGRRQGTGTLVTDTHVLTAAHVLGHGGPLTVQIWDAFKGEPLGVERLPLGADAAGLDIAVLTLGPGPGRPSPAKLWPAKRLPTEMKAFGYPKSDRPAFRGVWRDLAAGGEVQGGRVQLDWGDAGALAWAFHRGSVPDRRASNEKCS
jgi:hypothetical protein